MTDGTGSSPHDDNDFDTVEDIDAAVDAVTDDEVTDRLHRLLSDSVLAHLADLDPSRRHAQIPPAGPGVVDAADVDHVAGLLQATQQQLKIAQDALDGAESMRNELLFEAACAKIRLLGLERAAKAATVAADAYLDTVLDRSREILDEAHANAQRIVADAKAEADRIRAGGSEQVNLTVGHARGRPQPH